MIEHHCKLARLPSERIATSATFRLLAPARLNVVCFTSSGEPDAERVRRFLERVRDDGRLFLAPTIFQGHAAMLAAAFLTATARVGPRQTFQCGDVIDASNI